MTDRQRLQKLRRLLLARLSELEKERAALEREGKKETARRALRAFQEFADFLERFDDLLDT